MKKKNPVTKFQNYPLQLSDFQSPDLIEKQISQQNNYGSYEMQSWTLRGIRIRYIENQYHDFYTFERENNENLVALSFNLKGKFSIQGSEMLLSYSNSVHGYVPWTSKFLARSLGQCTIS